MKERVKKRKAAGGFTFPDYRDISTGIAEGRYGTLTEEAVREFLIRLRPVTGANDEDLLGFVAGIAIYLGEYQTMDARTFPACRAANREDLAVLIRDSKLLLARLNETKDRPFYLPETLMGVVFLTDTPAEGEDHETAYSFNKAFERSTSGLVGPLESFICEAERLMDAMAPRRRGRKSADSLGLIDRIAWFYSLYIDRPTSAPVGGFYIAVQLILEHLNLPFEDPSRGIREALRNFREPRINFRHPRSVPSSDKISRK